MDSQGASHSVYKLCGTTIVEELIHGPLHSHHGLDGISWSYVKHAARSDVEFKNILDTDVSVFTAMRSGDCSDLIDGLIPLVHVNAFLVGVKNLS